MFFRRNILEMTASDNSAFYQQVYSNL